MIWCRYSVGGDVLHGLVEGETVRKVEGAPWAAHKVTGQSSPLASVKLELPVIPSTFFCVGVNYRDHVERMAISGRATAAGCSFAESRLPERDP